MATVAAGCREESPTVKPAPVATATSAPLSAETIKATTELKDGLTKIINDADRNFAPLDYEYDEDLLLILDRLDIFLAAGSTAKAPRAMPRLDEAVEVAHLRETIGRWTAKTGKTLRPLIDPLKADVAARKPGGPPFHPDFHRQFAAAFDDLIPIEVAEIRERRNRAIHEQAKPLLDRYRDMQPDLVHAQEDFLSTPPYHLPLAKSEAPGP